MPRILRGLDSRALPCGCLVGVYETYGSQIVAIVDAKGLECGDRTHRVDSPVEIEASEQRPFDQPPSTIPKSSR